MTRLGGVAVAVAFAAFAVGSGGEHAAAQSDRKVPADTLIRNAFDYSFPIYEMMRVRWAYVDDPKNPSRGINGIAHFRDLIDYNRRTVTTPNNDTLYSRTFLDLSASPVRIKVPNTNGRYYSLAFYDAFSNHFATIGRRLTGTLAAEFTVVGPGWQKELPAGSRVIQAPSNDVLVLTRIEVDGEADLPAVRAIQDGIAVNPLESAFSNRPPGATPKAGDAASFVSLVNQAIGVNGVPSYETSLLEEWAAVGICGPKCTWDALPAEIKDAWNRQFPALLATLKKPIAGDTKPIQGWYYNPPNIGKFGTDYSYRAIVAYNALLAMESAEAVYPSVETDSDNKPLIGTSNYRLRIPPGGIPADAFWSLSMYEVADDARLYFTKNSISRYAIGDRTAGLTKNADGSVDIQIQRDAPAGGTSNWLPAPAGAFKMVMRAYQPKAELLDQRFLIPPLQRIP